MASPLESHRAVPPAYWRHVAAGLLFALFTWASFPPVGIWPLTLVSIVPLVWSAYRPARRPLVGAVCVTLGTLPLWFLQERWLIRVTEVGYPLLAIYLSLYAGLFVQVLGWTSRRFARGTIGWGLPGAVLVPVLWVGLEFVRGEIGLTGYAWFLVAQPLVDSAVLAAPAALFGTYFVSFLVAALAGALADATGWTPAPRRVGGMSAAVISVVWLTASIIGTRSPSTTDDALSLRVAVVQTNLPQDNKIFWTPAQRELDFERFVKLTRDAASMRPRPDLICWPETMYPGSGLNPEYVGEWTRLAHAAGVDPAGLSDVTMSRRLAELQAELGIPFVIGAQALDDFRLVPATDDQPVSTDARRYNSVFIVDAAGVHAQRYDKVELTPFGEVIPYLWRWKSAQAWIEHVGAGGMKFDLSFGRRPVALALDAAPVAAPAGGTTDAPPPTARRVSLLTPICFEATKSGHCRALAQDSAASFPDRPMLLINLSNDGWFGDSIAKREQHLMTARWRCVELGLPMVRAVNTGISCFIDPAGRVRMGVRAAGSTPGSAALPSGAGGEAGTGTARSPGAAENESAVMTEGVFAEAVILSPAPYGELGGGRTLFVRVGNAFGWGVLGASVLLPPAAMVIGRRKRRGR